MHWISDYQVQVQIVYCDLCHILNNGNHTLKLHVHMFGIPASI